MNRAEIDQMELTLNSRAMRPGRMARQKRRQRAQWWFGQMRRVVDAAMEWQPTPSARPEQVHLTLASKKS
jgi:hypothetical protein